MRQGSRHAIKQAAEEITRKTNGTIKVQIKPYGYATGFMQSWMSIAGRHTEAYLLVMEDFGFNQQGTDGT